jgi:hypothetical protein
MALLIQSFVLEIMAQINCVTVFFGTFALNSLNFFDYNGRLIDSNQI